MHSQIFMYAQNLHGRTSEFALTHIICIGTQNLNGRTMVDQIAEVAHSVTYVTSVSVVELASGGFPTNGASPSSVTGDSLTAGCTV